MKKLLMMTASASMLMAGIATTAVARDLLPFVLVYWVDKEEIPLKPGAKATAKSSHSDHIFVSEIYFNNALSCARALALLRLNFDSEAQGACLAQGKTTTP